MINQTVYWHHSPSKASTKGIIGVRNILLSPISYYILTMCCGQCMFLNLILSCPFPSCGIMTCSIPFCHTLFISRHPLWRYLILCPIIATDPDVICVFKGSSLQIRTFVICLDLFVMCWLWDKIPQRFKLVAWHAMCWILSMSVLWVMFPRHGTFSSCPNRTIDYLALVPSCR